MYKTYIDNTVFYKKQEYYAQGWILSEMERPESVMDIYDEKVSAVLVLQDGEYYATPPDFDMESFFDALINHLDYTNHVEELVEEVVDEDGDTTHDWIDSICWWTDPAPWNNGDDLEDDTHA